MLLNNDEVILLDNNHHFVNCIKKANVTAAQLTTSVEPIADGQHPYFDTDKQEWTDEPEKVAVPDKGQQLSMWLAQQVTALTSKVNSLELKASSQSSAAPASQSQTSSEPASQASSTSEGSAN